MFPAKNVWMWGVAFRQQMQTLRGPEPSQDLRQQLPNLHQNHILDIWESNGEPSLPMNSPNERTRRPQNHRNGNHETGKRNGRGALKMPPP